jgi:hypothetical protein
MTKHLMIDLETLATCKRAVILTLGAVEFDPYSDQEPWDPVYIKLDVTQQTEQGRVITDDTLDWWSKQSEEIQADAFSEDGRTTIREALDQLRRAVAHCTDIWAQGPQFDISILEDLYVSNEEPVPWRYGVIRDSRTLLSIAPDCRINELAHNSLADAYCQALGVRNFYKKYQIQPCEKNHK